MTYSIEPDNPEFGSSEWYPFTIPFISYKMESLDEILRRRGDQRPIPKIIHQIWYPPHQGAKIPDHWLESESEWKRLHPDHIHVLWDPQMGRNLVKTWYPHLLQSYDSFPHPIQRIDAIRPCFLHRYGGIYSDLDIVPLKNVTDSLEARSEIYLVPSSNNSSWFTNSLMVSKPGCKFWNFMIQRMIKEKPIWAIGKHLTVMSTTGPGALTDVISEYPGTICRLSNRWNPNGVHEIGLNKDIDPIVKNIKGQSWNSIDSEIINFVYINRVFIIFLVLLIIVILIYLLYRYSHKVKVLEFMTCSKTPGDGKFDCSRI